MVNDKKVSDHHAIIPTRSEHDLGRMGQDELKVYDLVAKRFLAIFHPDAEFERTRVETTVTEHVFRTSGRRLVEPGWKAVYGEEAEPERAEDDSGGDQLLPKLEQGEAVETRSVELMRKETQPPRRFTDASLLAAMETAGKEVEDAELREAMKDSGIGTPATRAGIIELLINREYVEREGRALVATEKGIQVIRLLGGHPLTSAELTGRWERRLGLIEQGERHAARVHDRHRQVHDRDGAGARQAEGRADRAGQARALPDLRPRDLREPQGLLVLVARGSRLRLRDLEEEGGQVAAGGGGQGADRVAAPVARGRRGPGRGAHREGRDRLPADAPGAPSGPSSGSSRSTRASGASSSTRSGPRSRPRGRPRRSGPRLRPRRPNVGRGWGWARRLLGAWPCLTGVLLRGNLPAVSGGCSPDRGFEHGRVPRAVRGRQLLELAAELFAERGYGGASMDELARRAGVTKPVVYELLRLQGRRVPGLRRPGR